MIGLVVGVPGVGKTTLVKKAREYLKNQFDFLTFGDILFNYLKNRFNLNNKDDIRKKVPPTEYYLAQIEVCKQIKKNAKDKDLLIDTHLLIKTGFGYFPGLSKEMTKYLDPSFIVIITANPSEILYRRLVDKSRIRDFEKTEDIDLHQKMTLSYAMNVAYDLHIPLIVIENPQGLLEESAKKLANMLSYFFK